MNGTEAQENCPSHFALDDHALHGDGRAAASHGDGCARCQARRAERVAAVAHFHDTIAAPLWTRVAAQAAERRRQRRRRFAFFQLPALLGAGGALAALVIAWPTAPSGYVGTKGRTVPVEIACRRGDRAFVLEPDGHVEPGDELRFLPRPVRPDARFIQIGSVDGTGRYTPFYPSDAGALSVALPAAGQALAGAIKLDDAPGPERLFVVLSPAPLSETAVRRIAEAGAAAGTTVDRIDGAPVTTSWIVLPKRAGARSSP